MVAIRWFFAYRTALECSLVWQWRKRSSFSVLVKAYLPDMISSDLSNHSDPADAARKKDSRYCFEVAGEDQ